MTEPFVTLDEVNAFLATDFPGGPKDGCADLGHGWATAVIRPEADGLRPGGIISGPTVFGLCDAVLYYACFTVIGLEPMALTSEMSIRYLRPALGGVLWARADIVSVGRRSVVGNVVAWTESAAKPVATCQGTYVRPR